MHHRERPAYRLGTVSFACVLHFMKRAYTICACYHSNRNGYQSDVQALHVKFVWPDENCSAREFCLWAGRVLRDEVIQHELASCQFNFNLLVHSDDQAPSASFLPSSSTVQVRTFHCLSSLLLMMLFEDSSHVLR
jgi:hypothetical protein